MSEETVQAQVMVRAIKDAAFRQELLSNPRAVLAEEYYVTIPENVTIRVLEDAPNTLSIVLPPQETAAQELSDADLEAVAGAHMNPTISLCLGDGGGCWNTRVSCS